MIHIQPFGCITWQPSHRKSPYLSHWQSLRVWDLGVGTFTSTRDLWLWQGRERVWQLNKRTSTYNSIILQMITIRIMNNISQISICFSNLIEITPTTNPEKDIKPKTWTYGVQRNRLQSNPEIYRNPSMTNPANTMSLFNSTRLGQPVCYSLNYNQHFLWKGRNQLERDKYLM